MFFSETVPGLWLQLITEKIAGRENKGREDLALKHVAGAPAAARSFPGGWQGPDGLWRAAGAPKA